MFALGMPNPVLWGRHLATVLNFIPYLGALIGVATVAVVALLSFDNTSPLDNFSGTGPPPPLTPYRCLHRIRGQPHHAGRRRSEVGK